MSFTMKGNTVKIFTALTAVIILVATLYINFLGGTGGINNISTGEVSGMYPALFTPAGSTFAIWSVIYLLNIAFMAVKVSASFKGEGQSNDKLLKLFIGICLVNTGWIFAWHNQQMEISVVLMLGLLVLLIKAFIETEQIEQKNIANTVIKANFSIYLGWICVASIANISALLIEWGVAHHTMTAMILTLVVILVAALLAAWQLITFKNGWYAAVIVWALYGIYKARIAEFSTMTEYVAWGAVIAMVLVLVTGGYVFTRKFVRLRS